MVITRKIRLKMERICLAEEARFATSVDPRLRKEYEKATKRAYERLADPQVSAGQRFMGIIRRLMESQKMSNQAALHTENSRSTREKKCGPAAAGSRR